MVTLLKTGKILQLLTTSRNKAKVNTLLLFLSMKKNKLMLMREKTLILKPSTMNSLNKVKDNIPLPLPLNKKNNKKLMLMLMLMREKMLSLKPSMITSRNKVKDNTLLLFLSTKKSNKLMKEKTLIVKPSMTTFLNKAKDNTPLLSLLNKKSNNNNNKVWNLN